MGPRTVVSISRLPSPTANSTSRLAPKNRSWTTARREHVLAAAARAGLDALGAQQQAHPRARRPRPCGGVTRRPSGVSTTSGRDDVAVDQVGAADEARDEAVGGTVVDLLRRGHLHQPAVAQHDDAVGERQRLVLVVGDEQRRDVLPLLDAPDLVAHRQPRRRVERRQRLVEQQRARARTRAPGRAPPAAAGRRRARAGSRSENPASPTSSSIASARRARSRGSTSRTRSG